MADQPPTNPRAMTTFLSLPGELRNTIYHLSLPPDNIDLPEPVFRRAPFLFSVHPQIRQEFQSLYYSKFSFRFRFARERPHRPEPERKRTDTGVPSDWLSMFGSEAFPHLREFELVFDIYPFMGDLYLAIGDKNLDNMQQAARPLARRVASSRTETDVWISGTGDLGPHTEHFAALLERRLEGRDQPGLEMKDFEDMVCEIGRLRRSIDPPWVLKSEAIRRRVYEAEIFNTKFRRNFRYAMSELFSCCEGQGKIFRQERGRDLYDRDEVDVCEADLKRLLVFWTM